MQLTQHQGRVGNVLQEGNVLLRQGKLTSDAESEIEEQMSLLNNRWEELRVRAMDKQSL